MLKRTICAGFVAAVLLVSVLANAADSDGKFDFGVAYGKSEHAFDANATSGTGTARSTTAGMWAGYHFTPNFGAQLNYWWLATGYGLPPVRIAQGGGVYVQYNEAWRDVDGWSVSGTATWPVNDWLHLTGRAGMFFWNAETSAAVFCCSRGPSVPRAGRASPTERAFLLASRAVSASITTDSTRSIRAGSRP
jgi:hypothetical protein